MHLSKCNQINHDSNKFYGFSSETIDQRYVHEKQNCEIHNESLKKAS